MTKKDKWKVCLFGFWVRMPEVLTNLFIGNTCFRVLNVQHTIGYNLKEKTIDGKKYVCWEKELMPLK
jgi:hypothetical protein